MWDVELWHSFSIESMADPHQNNLDWVQETTGLRKQPIWTLYLGHVIGY